MPLTRPVLVAGLAAGLLLTGAGPALALDEAQIVGVSCSGLRVTQQGLPVGATLEVKAMDADRARVLVARDARSSPAGRLDVAVRADLRGVHHVLVEVAGGTPEVEYGEVPYTVECPARPAADAAATPGAARTSPHPASSDPAGPEPAATGAPAPGPAAAPVVAAADPPAGSAPSGRRVAAALAGLAALAGAGLLVHRRLRS